MNDIKSATNKFLGLRDKFIPEKLQPEFLKPKDVSDNAAAPTPEATPNTGTLDDQEATELAKSTAFRRNLFLSPTAFARGTLSSTGRSKLNV